MSVALRDHFDHDLIALPNTERRIDARRIMFELRLDRAAAHGNNPAGIRSPLPFSGSARRRSSQDVLNVILILSGFAIAC